MLPQFRWRHAVHGPSKPFLRRDRAVEFHLQILALDWCHLRPSHQRNPLCSRVGDTTGGSAEQAKSGDLAQDVVDRQGGVAARSTSEKTNVLPGDCDKERSDLVAETMRRSLTSAGRSTISSS